MIEIDIFRTFFKKIKYQGSRTSIKEILDLQHIK